MLKLSQKKRKALLALAVAATVLGANNAFAASVHDKAISESNNYGASMRTYWQNQGVYDAKTHTYTFNEDITLKPKTSEQNLNYWTPLFGGIYVAGYNPVTIDMQGHRLDVAMNMDPVAQGAVFNPGAISPNVLHVTSSSLTINNVKGMELSAAGPGLATGNITGIYLAGTNQEGSYHDGKGLSSLTINNADGWDNAIKFHSSQEQVENGIYVWKNSGSADLKISGLVDMYVGNGSDVITVRGGDYTGDTQGAPTAYIGGGAFKTSTGRAANVVGGLLSVNSKLENGEIVASDANRDVQIDGNIRVGDVGRDQGTVTLGLNTADSYFKGIMYTNYGEGDAHMILQNGAQWTNSSTSQDSKDYHGSSLKQFVGSEGKANTGYIFQKDNAALNLGNYSGYTTVFYEHNNDGTKTADYTAGNVVVDTAKIGSNITLITDNVDVNNDATVKAALNALAGKLYYNAAKNGENALDGMAVIAEGLTASSKALKTADIYFNDQTGQGTTVSNINQTKTEFTTTLTGVNSQDGEYAEANVINDDGSYKFKKDSSIIMTNGASAIEVQKSAVINAEGRKLDLQVNSDKSNKLNGIKHNIDGSFTINAGELNVTAVNTKEFGSVRAIEINNDNKSVKPNAVINAKVNVKAEANNGNAYGLYSENGSTLTVNNDVVMNSGNEDEWAVNGKVYNNGLLLNSSAALFVKGGKATELNVNGNVDLAVNAHGLLASGEQGVINVNGGSITVNKATNGLYAIAALDKGTVNMNVTNGAAGANNVNINGNIGVIAGMMGSIGMSTADVNLGLGTDKSVLNGVIYNSFDSAEGKANLYLQNGATWNNASWGNIINDEESLAFTGSHVTKFAGGSDEAHAGNIFQKDANKLTIDNYSGNTNIFYEHEGNGEAAADYKAGDTIIKAAAKDSVVSLITDNKGISMDNDASVANVLNALAGKLTYSNFTKGEKNLTGYVKIADGLTASSKAKYTADITFNESGKGTYDKAASVMPDHQVKTEFTTTLTGVKADDGEYVAGGVFVKDGSYKFTENSSITTDDKSSIDLRQAATIDAKGKTLTLNANSSTGSTVYGLGASSADGVTVNAGKLVINGSSTNGRVEGINVGQGAQSKDKPMKLTINGDTEFNMKGIGYTLGLYAAGNSEVTFNGNVTAMGNENSEWGLTSEKGAFGYYGCSLVYSGSNYSLQMGPKVTINGDVNAKIDGNGLFANGGHAKLTINGGGNIEINKDNTHNYYAMIAESGTTSMNVNLDENYDAVSARDNKLVLKGNVGASTGAINANEPELYTKVNLGLATADSVWTGIAYNGFKDEGNSAYGSDKKFYGAINVFLQNGATWNNEQWGAAVKGFKGSHVAKFVGGASEATAGNIFQKDSRNLTIDNYSGNTNIFYAHEGNGEAAENYKAGNTIIKGAAAGSVVSMITDNTGIAMDNADSVTNVLNALAGKLTYSNYVNGENNLTGYVKIADGLTASSAALKTGGIAFNKEDGKGSYKKLPKTAFTTAITGDLEADTEYAGNIADGKYFFDGDSTITVGAATAADIKKALTIDAADHKLSIIATGGNWSEEKTFKHNAEGTTKITAGELVIGQPDGGYYDRTGMFVENGTVDITAAKTTVYAQNDFYTVTYGVHASNNNSRVDIHGDLDLKFNFAAPVHGLVADKGAAINVDGKASIDMSGRDGNAVAAINSGSAVNVGGGTIKAWNGQRNTSYGLLADSGIVNVNMNDDKTAAGTVTTVISGNVRANGEDGMINVGLSDKKSSLTGVAFSQNNGVINMYLNNGAAWNNQVWGKTDGGFGGSHVAKLAGGATEATAGNIFQKDSRNLTIDNYSGNTNIFYAHTGNGEDASDYAAGDTIIKGAAAGSVVSMITDNTGINMDNGVCVTNVLNALAGKLTYSNFVNGEKNLAGYVKIADGLTASSAAMQTGNIAFNADTGKGSLENGSMKPGFTYPETQTPESSKLNSGITGDAKADYQYKKDGILKEDGTYVFTQDPTKIEVESGAAVDATENNINIDTTKAKLELKGETGINANGADVTVKGNTDISGNVGINAANGNVTLNGSSTISGTDAAIKAGENGNVNVNGNNSALTINGSINADGGNITVDSGKASSTINGDVDAANGGSIVINLTEKNSEMTGGYNVDGDSSIVMNIANGAIWNLTDGDEAAGMSLLRMAKAPAAAPAKGLTINGGKTEAETGYLNMTKRTKALKIANYSGWETIIYGHENAGADVADYKSGDTVIDKAEKGSGVILSTDNSGIDMKDKNAVEATLKALAQKVTYSDHEANGVNLTGKVQIAEGLTSSNKGVNIGTMHWDENGKGKYDLDSVNWSQIIEGDYETFVMKGVRSAATTSLHTWRDNMQDTYTGADLADEDGMFAKALGGKTSSDVKGLKDSNTYYGVQVGYDKAAANGWHTGVAFDYRNGDSNYLLGGKGDNQMYSLGVYGVKSFENDAFFRVAAKVGRVQNEYDVYNEIRSLKLHGDYKANAYGLTMEYGKTFGTEESYFTPKAQLTWSQVGAKDYTAHTDKATMQINQDSYSSFVGRLGFEAGVKSEKGRVYAGLFAAHEFNGDISASYFANDGDRKHTSFDGEETWMEMKLGGSYDFSNNAHLYADIAKDFGGNFERKWKLNAGLRFEF